MNGPSPSVVIVGAGPVGLALANELGYRGVSFLVVDEGAGEILFPAGEGIFSRTMEHLRRWGIAHEVRHSPGFPDDLALNMGFATSLDGYLVAAFDTPSNGAMPHAARDVSPEGIAIIPKDVFDPALRRSAERYACGAFRNHARLTGFRNERDGVVCDLLDLDRNEPFEVRTSYLAGCDGARSAVRKHLDIPFIGTFGEGHNFAVSFRAPGLHERIERQFGRRFFQLHTINTPHRPYFTTVDGRERWRMSMYVERDHDPDPAQALAAAIGEPLECDIIRAQPWTGHRVVAQSYGGGRVFLLGDAAHLRWPKGGFGANTGVGDAVDLGWKLAAVIAGWGGDALLASYETERRPIAVRNVNEAANNRALDALIRPDPLLDEDSPGGAAERARVGNDIFALRLREYRTQGIQLGYRYRNSPICVADGTLEPPDDHQVYYPSTFPGGRAPHAWLADGRSMLDLYGRGFVLVRFDDDVAIGAPLRDAAAAAGMPLAEVFVDRPQIAALYERRLVLVRPDGHVAWRGDAVGDAKAIVGRVRGAGLPVDDLPSGDRRGALANH